MLTALAFGLLISAHAQTWFPVAQESGASTLTLPAGTTYQLGVAICPAANNGPAWSAPLTVAADTVFNPLSAGTAGVFPFSDPCQNVIKTLQVQETSAAQILTLNGAPFTVPALAVSTVSSGLVNCPAPTTFDANPTVPLSPPNCAPLANEIPVASDGATVTNLAVATPVIFQYCTGSGTGQICDAPFMFIDLPIDVGPNAACGGFPMLPAPAGSASLGTLYVAPAGMANLVLFSNAAGIAQPPLVVPAATPTSGGS
jgi:hypothetical protein